MNDIVKKMDTPVAAPAIPAGVSPLVEMLLTHGADLDLERIEKFMELQERNDANEARKAFHASLAAAKAEMPVVKKSGKNQHLNSTYATLEDLLAVANPVLARHGLSVSWSTTQADGAVSAVCIVTHEMGHSEPTEPVTMPISPGNKAVNPAQNVGISMSYARRYSLTNALGMATEDADGGGPEPQQKQAPPRKKYTDDQFVKQMAGWKAKLESEELSAEHIITQVRNHIELTESQNEQIQSLRDYTPALQDTANAE